MHKLSRLQHQDSKRLFLYIVVSAIVLYFIFSPGVNILYYMGDDYKYAFGGPEKLCSTDDGFYFVKAVGRPLQGYIDCISYKFAYTLERMRINRIFSVAVLGLGMGLLSEFFYLIGFSIATAFFMAGCLFLIKNLYDDSVLTGAISLPVPAVLVLLAYFALEKVNQILLNENKVRSLKVYFWYGISVLLILLALFTYPAVAFLFVSLILVKTLFAPVSDWAKSRIEIFRAIKLFSLACIIYFVYEYYKIHFHSMGGIIPATYKLDRPNFHPSEILTRIILLANLFDPSIWGGFLAINMTHQAITSIVILLAGSLFGLLSFIHNKYVLKKENYEISSLVQIALVTCMLVLLANAFELIIPERVLASRLLIGTVTSGIVLVFWGIYRISAALPLPKAGQSIIFSIAVAILFLMAGNHANLATMSGALSHAQYLNSAKSIIGEYIKSGKQLHHVHYIIIKEDFPYDRYFQTNAALVQLSGHQKFQLEWCSLPRGAREEEKDHQAEAAACVIKQPKGTIAVTYSRIGEPFQNTSTTVLVKVEYNTVEADVGKMII